MRRSTVVLQSANDRIRRRFHLDYLVYCVCLIAVYNTDFDSFCKFDDWAVFDVNDILDRK